MAASAPSAASISSVNAGEFVAILGPNGAGKSTLMKTVIGVLRSSGGTIRFEDSCSTAWARRSASARGIGIIPEGRQLFPDMTVRENLMLGAYARLGVRIPGAIEDALARVFAMFPRLAERRAQFAGSLSGGEAQMVAIGRALMAQPRLLLCDEPSLGLAPQLVRELLTTLRRLRARRHHHPARRPERDRGAAHRRSRLHPRHRPRRCRRRDTAELRGRQQAARGLSRQRRRREPMTREQH